MLTPEDFLEKIKEDFGKGGEKGKIFGHITFLRAEEELSSGDFEDFEEMVSEQGFEIKDKYLEEAEKVLDAEDLIQ